MDVYVGWADQLDCREERRVGRSEAREGGRVSVVGQVGEKCGVGGGVELVVLVGLAEGFELGEGTESGGRKVEERHTRFVRDRECLVVVCRGLCLEMELVSGGCMLLVVERVRVP